ncbi:tRNA lysidine(34) synthetase TilS [Halomonas binhaiensis]|uniref:tRNA(Ile)-lysidine synthase n=1 Tax=Halomonas binhaiensis TaxID=2562282 RepID=A0A5C1NAA5_9GAMM|nr:tRNA lysidine(34) synthetase TilS [Halomonas binhaiensis]QEM80642.1 tRNA lysidine(34) synthetase TilS [Halomonas binhaiensis]
MSLSSHIERALVALPPGRAVWIALSGGLDSSLLLSLAASACRRYPRPLYALHVNHGLQAAAGDFESHCRWLCSHLEVPLVIESVSVDLSSGEGLEGAARRARYSAFARRLSQGDVLWLAQHRDDQAETFLLAALRRSGVTGLAAMPYQRDIAGVTLQRPLLDVSRVELEATAQEIGLVWVEDPTNAELEQDRNYLRHKVMPLLGERWPGASAALASTAGLAGETHGLLNEFAEEDLTRLGGMPERLPVDMLTSLSLPRQRLLVRHCASRLGLQSPPAARLESLLAQLKARDDAQVHVGWPGSEARRWRRALWLMPADSRLFDQEVEWDGQRPLKTPWGPCEVRLQRQHDDVPAALTVRPRQGGERLCLLGRGRRDLKRLLQEEEVPPWRRRAIAVVWCDGESVAALDLVEGRWLAVAVDWVAFSGQREGG